MYLPDDLYRELKLLARVGKKNFSQLIREGAAVVVKRKQVKGKKFGEGFIGAGKTTVKTNAVKDISDYYRNGAI